MNLRDNKKNKRHFPRLELTSAWLVYKQADVFGHSDKEKRLARGEIRYLPGITVIYYIKITIMAPFLFRTICKRLAETQAGKRKMKETEELRQEAKKKRQSQGAAIRNEVESAQSAKDAANAIGAGVGATAGQASGNFPGHLEDEIRGLDIKC